MSRALGRYELLRPLARGGMAEVYLARRRAAGVEKWLVVKRIRAERAADVQFLDLFVREARLSMSLAHQNIVPVFDFGRIDDQVFLAMERVEGKDLGSSLARGATLGPAVFPLSPLLAAFIAAECCQALDYAHRRKSPDGAPLGIVHRDVTPRNVLLSWSGEVKLTDFGIASLAGDATTQLLGTPAYMAPEQARKEPLDARTDVYAIGLVLREMLTGQRARPGSDRESLIAAARAGTLAPWPAEATSAPADPASPAAEAIPPALIAIVDRATAAAPADRHADARALLAELDEVIVAERAARKADAPARQLAAWLDAVWTSARDDDAGAAGDIVADHMVSFLDDGALDVIGTGTQRSLLATAADEPAEAPERAPSPAAPSPSGASPPAPSPPALSPPAASPPALAPVDPSSPAPSSRASARALRLAVPVLGVLAVAALAVGLLRDRGTTRALDAGAGDASLVAPSPSASPATAADASAIPASDEAAPGEPTLAARGDAATIAGTTGDAAVSARPAIAAPVDAAPRDAAVAKRPDAAVVARTDTRVDAAVTARTDTRVDAAVVARTDTRVDAAVVGRAEPRGDAAVGTRPDAARDVVLRTVTVNTATDWAYVRVNDTTEQFETPHRFTLAPGKHMLHFHNPPLGISLDVAIEVPADRDINHVQPLRR